MRARFLRNAPMTTPSSSRPSIVHLPQGNWATVLDCLCARFPTVDRATWRERMARGRVLDAAGQPIGEDRPYQTALRVQYFREVPAEKPIPFEERVLYQDEHLLVADKPHFLPVQPSGEYVEQSLLNRLCRRVDNPHLAPLHRIDRLTAGLVLFSTNPATRGAYQALFRERRMHKRYEALCAPLPQLEFPLIRRTRIVDGELFFTMQEVPGAPNSETRIEVLERGESLWRYALYPVSGRRHQLRVQMAALGAGICNDPLYPVLWPREEREREDFSRPLKLLAQALCFDDPLTGAPRHFQSSLRLD